MAKSLTSRCQQPRETSREVSGERNAGGRTRGFFVPGSSGGTLVLAGVRQNIVQRLSRSPALKVPTTRASAPGRPSRSRPGPWLRRPPDGPVRRNPGSHLADARAELDGPRVRGRRRSGNRLPACPPGRLLAAVKTDPPALFSKLMVVPPEQVVPVTSRNNWAQPVV